jgi:hypothetical protein
LGQQGVISASQGHACSECTHPFRPSNDPDDMDVEQGFATMHVVDGIVMGPTRCGYEDCENELLTAWVDHFVFFMNRSMETSAELLVATKI